MQNDFWTELNASGRLESNAQTPFKKLDELEIGKEYEVIKIYRQKSNYGDRIVVALPEFKTNLPHRFVELLSDDNKLSLLNSTISTLKFKYLGKKGKYNMVEFVNL